MARPRIYTDEQRKQKQKESNDKPINQQRRRENSLIYYYKKQIEKREAKDALANISENISNITITIPQIPNTN